MTVPPVGSSGRSSVLPPVGSSGRSSVFDAVADDYDTYRPGYPEQLFATIETYAGSLRGARVLDLAAGTGIATRELVRCGAHVVAADLGAEMLRVLRRRTPGVPALVARGEALPFRPGGFDVVTCATAWHWIDPERGTAEVRRVLRAGGHLAVWWAGAHTLATSEAAADNREHEIYARWRVGELAAAMFTNRGHHEPEEQLADHGLTPVDVQTFVSERTVTVDERLRHVATHSPMIALGDDLPGLIRDLRAAYAGQDTMIERLSCRLVLSRRE